MRNSYEERIANANEIERQICQSGADIWLFGKVAKMIWPAKTAAHLAAIACKDERTGARWLAGEFEPPGIVLATVLMKMLERKKH